ncbi:hypothetical protein PtB15_11B174 [Puccinia triticina]|nr:hypothetical protein PtB15_11B174 [Puccinia triticina]
MILSGGTHDEPVGSQSDHQNRAKREDESAIYLCIDGGGTKTNVSIAGRLAGDGNGKLRILSQGQHRSSNYTGVGLEQAILSIGDATIAALRSLPAGGALTQARSWTYDGFQSNGCASRPAPFARIWAGLSGVDGPEDHRLVYAGLANLFGLTPFLARDPDDQATPRLKVTNDCDLLCSAIETVYKVHKFSPDTPCLGGIVLIAGTGSIATAFGPSSKATQSPDHHAETLEPLGRLGGYGYLLGDEGSSYYVGQQTIKMLLAFFDCHQEPRKSSMDLESDPTPPRRKPLGMDDQALERSSLLAPVMAHFEIDRLENLLASVYSITSEHERKLKIAELSRLVMRAAFDEQQPDRDLVLQTMRLKWNANWGWVETVHQPDQVAAVSLV